LVTLTLDDRKPSENFATMPAKIENSSNIQLPPFWANDVQNWFVMVEFKFQLAGITNEETKFLLVGSSLPPEVFQELNEILTNQPEEAPYSTLKNALIRRKTISEDARIQQLMSNEHLGDRLPSEMLRSMQRLVGDRAFDKTMFKSLFLQKLPQSIREILAPMERTAELSELADSADRIHQIQNPSAVHAIAGPSRPRERDDELYNMVQNLSRQMQTLQLHYGRRLRSPAPRRSRSNSRSRPIRPSPVPDSEICWFHQRHGSNARNCRSPCKFNSEPAGNGQARQ
jgi:hypothetical protein